MKSSIYSAWVAEPETWNCIAMGRGGLVITRNCPGSVGEEQKVLLVGVRTSVPENALETLVLVLCGEA